MKNKKRCELLPVMLKGVILKNNGDFHYMKYFYLLRIKFNRSLYYAKELWRSWPLSTKFFD